MKSAEEWFEVWEKQGCPLDGWKAATLRYIKMVQQDSSRSGCERGVMEAAVKPIPPAPADEKRNGWTVQYALLDKITDTVNAKSEDGICLEHTEAVILELVKLGFCLLDKPKEEQP